MDDRRRAARREAWRSFGHKLGIVAVALVAYFGLVALGGAKHSHENTNRENWQLTPQRLRDLANAAGTVAPNQKGGAFNADVKLLDDIATEFKGGGKDVKGTIDTKQEFVVAVEQIVDARIWREATHRISKLEPDPAQQSAALTAPTTTAAATTTATPSRSSDAEHFLDRVAVEESLARTRISGTHALIEASATQLLKQEAKLPPPIATIFDEKHPLHIVYEICWYLLLALAVLASSWLLLTIFTVLPFTDAEGYWTKRIGELLQKFAPGITSAALPLVSATLVAATVFAGTSLVTTPGGYARPTTNVRTTIEDRSIHPPPPPPDIARAVEAITALAGRINESETRVAKLVANGTSSVQKHLRDADERQKKTLTAATNAQSQAQTAATNANQASSHAQLAVKQTESVPTIQETTKGIATAIGTPPPPLQPLVDHVGTIASAFDSSSKEIGKAKETIDDQYARESQAREASLAQAAMVDRRGFLARTFWRAQFKVGPGAVRTMATLAGVTFDSKGKPVKLDKEGKPLIDSDAVAAISVLIAAMDSAPMYSGEFREELDTIASKNVAPALRPKVKQFLEDHDRELLHLCALQRD